jgi:nitroimidazol reductase NimA-like FMN-containing flavoprotein (pyridoxamine 5'-phosphate oxidase superfamily)
MIGGAMSTAGQPITFLPDEESWQLLASRTFGRLVTSVDGQPEIFPVNFVVQDGTVLFRTAHGTKLFGAAANNRVAFEVDGHTMTEGWSVIVKGTAHILATRDEVEEAQRAHLVPWTATVKTHFVRVIPSGISGRRFQFGSEPDVHGAALA